ncbi:MAG: hypothetical protein AABX77_01455 [Nanoarchaeota archaeon]
MKTTKTKIPAVFAAVFLISLLMLGIAAAKIEVSNSADTKLKIDPFKLKKEASATSISEFSSNVESETGSGVNSETSVTSEDSLDEATIKIDKSIDSNFKLSRPAIVSSGIGWAIDSNNEGNFAKISFVKKHFIDVNSNEETVKARGFIKIGKNPTYEIVLTEESENQMVFDVMTRGTAKVQGVLKLNLKTSLVEFNVWDGTLALNSGETYNLNLATKHSKLKEGKKVYPEDKKGKIYFEEKADAKSDGEKVKAETKTEAKIGEKQKERYKERAAFWARMKAFFRIE